jgi:hypothetical protein
MCRDWTSVIKNLALCKWARIELEVCVNVNEKQICNGFITDCKFANTGRAYQVGPYQIWPELRERAGGMLDYVCNMQFDPGLWPERKPTEDLRPRSWILNQARAAPPIGAVPLDGDEVTTPGMVFVREEPLRRLREIPLAARTLTIRLGSMVSHSRC